MLGMHYGVVVETETLPWVKTDMDVNDWWRKECGYDQKVYDKDGNRLPGVTSVDVLVHWMRMEEVNKLYPAPFRTVETPDGLTLVRVPGMGYQCYGPFAPMGTEVSKEVMDAYMAFLEKYVETDRAPQWHVFMGYE